MLYKYCLFYSLSYNDNDFMLLAILVIYLNRALNYDEDTSTAIYHGFNVACYFMPIFGAILADGFIGKYK